MESTTLLKIFKGEAPKTVILNLLIKQKITAKTFKACDETLEADVVVETAKIAVMKNFNIGNKVRIIAPRIDEKKKLITITDKTKVYTVHVKKESLGDKIDPNLKDLTLTYGFDKKQDIQGRFLIKIVKKKKEEPVRLLDGTMTVELPLVIKDIHGNKAPLSIWPNHKKFDSIIENKVYYMEFIKTGMFPDEKPHGLNSKWGFKLIEASDAIAGKFSKISYIDGTATGNILGFKDIYRYDVCKACFKKVNGEKNGNCIECNQPLVIVPYFNFHVDITIAIESDEEEIIQFKGFKKMINDIKIEDLTTDEQLQEGYFGKKVEITYITEKKKNLNGKMEDKKTCESFKIIK